MSGQPTPDAELDEALALVNDDHGRRTGRHPGAGSSVSDLPNAQDASGDLGVPGDLGDLGDLGAPGHDTVPRPPAEPASTGPSAPAPAGSAGPAPTASASRKEQGATANGHPAGPGARHEQSPPSTPRPSTPPTPSAPPTPGPDAPTSTPSTPRPPNSQATHRDTTPWPAARAIAARAIAGRAPRSVAPGSSPVAPGSSPGAVPLGQALGLVLAAPLVALTDLPSFDTSAMDGWAVAGPGPWEVRADGILAGHGLPEPLADGEAVRIATGARIPREATAVIRSEHGLTDDKGRLHPRHDVTQGQDIRPRGQECRSGDQLLPPGTLVTPAVLGLAAAAGYDALTVVPRPCAEVLILGDELLTEGLPHEGLIRDALGPMLPPWLRSLGADVIAVRRLGDDAEALHQALTTSAADLVVTTGGTASGPVDHVHPTLRRIGAELLVDGVAVRPGHPMLLARLRPDQHLVGLPGNPLAAVSGLLTLAEPLLRTLSGRPATAAYTAVLREDVHGHPHDTRLVPVTLRADHAVPLHYNGPAMLRGIAVADGLAVVPPGGGRRGQELEVLDLPWALPDTGTPAVTGVATHTGTQATTDPAGECFT